MTMLKEKPEMTQATEATTQRILVVDDENSISELIATSLRFVGFDVRTAATGSEALTIAEEFKPHALILDVMLPDQNGFEVCRQLRQDGHNVGVLFLTAKDTVEDGKFITFILGNFEDRAMLKQFKEKAPEKWSFQAPARGKHL